MDSLTPLTFFDYIPHGATYEPEHDRERLGKQMTAVRDYMLAHDWVTLAQLHKHCGGSEAGVSARIRDLRKLGYTVERERVAGGLFRYRIVQ